MIERTNDYNNNKAMLLKYLPIIIPAALGFITSAKCNNLSSAGANIPFRPPPVVFGIVWPILYILLGFAWFYERKRGLKRLVDVIFGALSFTLALWIYFYSCLNNKIYAVWTIAVCVLFTIMAMCISGKRSRLMLAPLITWLFFATLLSIQEF